MKIIEKKFINIEIIIEATKQELDSIFNNEIKDMIVSPITFEFINKYKIKVNMTTTFNKAPELINYLKDQK